MKRMMHAWLANALLLLAQGALAWSNHALATWKALAAQPGLHDAAPVAAESLESFLASEGGRLDRLLAEEEQWARSHVPLYPPRPEALAFRAAGSPAQARQEMSPGLCNRRDAMRNRSVFWPITQSGLSRAQILGDGFQVVGSSRAQRPGDGSQSSAAGAFTCQTNLHRLVARNANARQL